MTATTAVGSATTSDRVGPSRRVSEVRLAGAVARIEGGRLAGVALLPCVAAYLITRPPGTGVYELRLFSIQSGFGFLLPAAVMLVASHRAVTRDQRTGAMDLFDATPAPPRVRTAGHLLAVTVPTAMAVVTVAVSALLATRAETTGRLVPAELVVGPLLVAGAGCLGVLVARTWPQRMAPYLACVAVAAAEVSLHTPRHAGSGFRWLAFWVEGTFWWLLPRPATAHLVYLAGLVAMAATGALLRHGATRRLLAAGVVSVAVVAGAATAQMRQPSAHWERANAMFAAPDTIERCTQRDGIEYCTFDGHERLVGHWDRAIGAVRAALPDDAAILPLTVNQRVSPLDLQHAGDAARHLPHVPDFPREPRLAAPPEGEIHTDVEWGWSTTQLLGLALRVAATAVDLPVAPRPDDGTICSAAGQARAVVALWATAHATPNARKELASLVAAVDGSRRGAPDRAFVLTEKLWEQAPVPYGGFALSTADARLALAMAEAPGAAEIVSQHWADLLRPSATTADLAAATGLTPVPVGPSRTLQGPDGIRIAGECS